MLREFRDFIVRGNALELAIAVVLGAAFGAVVTSVVDDVLMQIIAAVFGQPDFAAIAIPLGDAEIRIGLLINALINLMFVGLALFLIVKLVIAARRKSDEDAPEPEDLVLLREIRDLLRERG